MSQRLRQNILISCLVLGCGSGTAQAGIFREIRDLWRDAWADIVEPLREARDDVRSAVQEAVTDLRDFLDLEAAAEVDSDQPLQKVETPAFKDALKKKLGAGQFADAAELVAEFYALELGFSELTLRSFNNLFQVTALLMVARHDADEVSRLLLGIQTFQTPHAVEGLGILLKGSEDGRGYPLVDHIDDLARLRTTPQVQALERIVHTGKKLGKNLGGIVAPECPL